jgi:CRP-like cAMP-binding protein
MRDGDAADRMFIVRAGRLAVVHEGPPETLLRIPRRGFGQLALLRECTRSASVYARRDSELARRRARRVRDADPGGAASPAG